MHLMDHMQQAVAQPMAIAKIATSVITEAEPPMLNGFEILSRKGTRFFPERIFF